MVLCVFTIASSIVPLLITANSLFLLWRPECLYYYLVSSIPFCQKWGNEVKWRHFDGRLLLPYWQLFWCNSFSVFCGKWRCWEGSVKGISLKNCVHVLLLSFQIHVCLFIYWVLASESPVMLSGRGRTQKTQLCGPFLTYAAWVVTNHCFPVVFLNWKIVSGLCDCSLLHGCECQLNQRGNVWAGG